MSVNFTVFSSATVLLLLSPLITGKRCLQRTYDWLIFSKSAPIATLGTGAAWFLWNVLHLSTADFGEHRVALFAVFFIIIALAFFKMRELLAVRGLAVLLLLYSDAVLGNIYCEEIFLKNFFVALIYAAIVFAMLIGSLPYLLRDFMQLLLLSKWLRISLGMCSLACGLLLVFPSLPMG